MNIDRADWHCEDAYEVYHEMNNISDDRELTDEQDRQVWLYASDHIGLFIKWITDNHYEGEDCDEEGIELVRNGDITGAEYLMDYCDGKFAQDDVREDIWPFVNSYYYESSDYLKDYGDVIIGEESAYAIISGKDNYCKMKAVIDEKFKKWSDNNL